MKTFNVPQFYNGFCCYLKSICSSFDKAIKLFTLFYLHPTWMPFMKNYIGEKFKWKGILKHEQNILKRWWNMRGNCTWFYLCHLQYAEYVYMVKVGVFTKLANFSPIFFFNSDFHFNAQRSNCSRCHNLGASFFDWSKVRRIANNPIVIFSPSLEAWPSANFISMLRLDRLWP